MSNYVVSARKYRPMRFDEVIGQNHISNTLKNALKTDHLGHSFLFCGPRGVGKTTSARILAKVLNCENRTEDFEPCNTCSSCTAFNQNQSFNIYELDAASNNSVENIRELVEQVRFAPQQGDYKVYIIDEVHMLSQAAFNAFLKTLEEPPSYAIFILATTEKHKILPTILSRCQIFDFNRVQVKDIVKHLQSICKEESIDAEENALHIIAQKADGALRDALSIFDRIVSLSGQSLTTQDVNEGLNLLDADTYFEMTNHLLLQDKNQTLLLFDQISKNGFDGDQLMLGLGEHFRNLLVVKESATRNLLEASQDVIDKFVQQSDHASLSFLMNALNIANQCDIQFKQAKNKRLHVELALLKMCYLSTMQKNVALETPNQLQEKKKDEGIEPVLEQPKEIIPEDNIDQPEIIQESDVVEAPIKIIEEQKKSTQQKEEPISIEEKEGIVIEEESLEEKIVIPNNSEAVSEEISEQKESEAVLVLEEPEIPIDNQFGSENLESTGEIEENVEKIDSEDKAIEEEIPAEQPKPSIDEKSINSKIQPALSFRLSKLNEAVAKRNELKKDHEKQPIVDIDKENPEVSHEQIEQAWFSLSEKVQSVSLSKGITDSKIKFENEHLHITVFGKVIKDYLKEHHNLIISTIQQQTGLHRFTYEVKCVELDKENVKTYTKEEELAYIQQQNPSIKKLCDDLNLEIRYD